ncbi:MAG: SpoIID/LytB domain-containing protein [Desulfobacterales bacterium]|nr:MAG: SpoIID/LytB domain-containing protein [Desulfobacterales bacterium]
MIHYKKNQFFTLGILLCVLCVVFTSSSTAEGAYDSDDYFVIANDLLNKGMYLEAMGIYEEISKHSDHANNRARALLLTGTTYSLYLDLHDDALKHFEYVIKHYPASPSAPEALFNAGIVFYEKGQFKRAYEVFTYYITQYPRGLRRQSAEVWADSSKDQMTAAKTPVIPPVRPSIKDTTIRVLIENNVKRVVVNSAAPITVMDPLTRQPILTGPGPLVFIGQGTYFTVNGRNLHGSRCRVTTESTTLKIDSRRYRGHVSITATSGGLEVVNSIPLEQYLYGVVPKEMSHKWDKEALMAQAVAARTYVLYVKNKNSDKPYDVEATTASQVYGGYEAETYASNSAVDGTHGQVMTYNGSLIIAYFHANSGGHTEDAKNVWSADIPYLRGIPDRYSERIPGGSWEYFLSYEDVRNRLNRHGLGIGRIRELKSTGLSRSGRNLQVKVVSDQGTYALKSNNFRIKVGMTKLKSTRFRMQTHRRGILIRGNGYGHGVGMSQWGANRMAQAGFKYQDILKHYYRGVRIVSLDNLQG